jgi:hypothetical protein
MSIVNRATGRHEDDLMDEAARNNGTVSVVHLIEHLEEIIGARDVFGSNAADAARTAAYLLRVIGMQHPEVLDLQNAEVPLLSPRYPPATPVV